MQQEVTVPFAIQTNFYFLYPHLGLHLASNMCGFYEGAEVRVKGESLQLANLGFFKIDT